MEYKGRLYAKINGKYIECTETVQDLEIKILKLEVDLDKASKCQCCEKGVASVCNSCLSGIAQETGEQAYQSR